MLALRASKTGRLAIAGTWRGRTRAGTRVVVCRAAKAVRRAGAVSVRCAWTRRGRALLATRSLRVSVAAVFRPTGGAPVRVARVVTAARLGPEPITG